MELVSACEDPGRQHFVFETSYGLAKRASRDGGERASLRVSTCLDRDAFSAMLVCPADGVCLELRHDGVGEMDCTFGGSGLSRAGDPDPSGKPMAELVLPA